MKTPDPVALADLLAAVRAGLLRGHAIPRDLELAYAHQLGGGTTLAQARLGELQLVDRTDGDFFEGYLDGPDAAVWRAMFAEIAFFAKEADGGLVGYWLHSPALLPTEAPIVWLTNEGSFYLTGRTFTEHLLSRAPGESEITASIEALVAPLGLVLPTLTELQEALVRLPSPEERFFELREQHAAPPGALRWPILTDHAATRLLDGSILIAGGRAEDERADRSFLLAPGSDEFAPAAQLPLPRTDAVAIALPDGGALVVGGGALGDSTVEHSSIRCGAGASEWSPAGTFAARRAGGHALCLLEDGRVLAIGGRDDELAPTNAIDCWYPDENAWREVARLPRALSEPIAVRLPGGRVLIAGGQAAPEKYAFEPVRDAFLLKPQSFTLEPAPPMRVKRRGHLAALLVDGRVLVVGGEEADVPDTALSEPEREAIEALGATWEWYDPAKNTWTLGGALPRSLAEAALAQTEGGVPLVLGGYAHGRLPLEILAFDVALNRFTEWGRLRLGRTETSALFQRDRLVVIGGKFGSYYGDLAAPEAHGATGKDATPTGWCPELERQAEVQARRERGEDVPHERSGDEIESSDGPSQTGGDDEALKGGY